MPSLFWGQDFLLDVAKIAVHTIFAGSFAWFLLFKRHKLMTSSVEHHRLEQKQAIESYLASLLAEIKNDYFSRGFQNLLEANNRNMGTKLHPESISKEQIRNLVHFNPTQDTVASYQKSLNHSEIVKKTEMTDKIIANSLHHGLDQNFLREYNRFRHNIFGKETGEDLAMETFIHLREALRHLPNSGSVDSLQNETVLKAA